MNILIVDDEVLSVDSIADSLPWSELGISNVYRAYSMKQAQQVFSKETVDILLCDIEMPRGNGIDLMEWIRSQNFSPVCIFLTCYSSFDYAASAVRLQMFDYVLKPCEYTKLAEIIQRAVLKAKEIQEKQQWETHGKYWDADYQNRLSNFWNSLLLGDVSCTTPMLQQELSYRHLSLDIMKDDYYLLLIKAIPTNQFLDCQDNSWRYIVRNIISELLNAPPVLILNTLFLAIVPSSCFDTVDDFGKASIHLISTLSSALSAVFIGYYSSACPISDTPEILQALEKESMEKYCMQNAVFRFGKKYATRENYIFSEERWLDSLLSGHAETIPTDVSRFLTSPSPYHYIDRQLLNSIYHQVLKTIYHALERHRLSTQQDFLSLSSTSENSIFYSVHTLCSWIENATEKCVELIAANESMSSVIDEVACYIKENLNSELTRVELTKVAHLHPDYLSTYFKSKMGISLSEYITKERIREAKSLLLSTDLPINEIAMQTGFQSIPYFSKQFKKLEHMTPFQYRKINRKSK